MGTAINPLDIFELVRKCKDGLTPQQVEKALGLNRSVANYHLNKGGFRRTDIGTYVVATDDPDTFLILSQYVAYRAGNSPVATKLPFERNKWEFKTLPEQFQFMIELCKSAASRDDWNFEKMTSENNLKVFQTLGEMMLDYVRRVATDPRYIDPDAREFILRNPEG